MTTSSVYCLQGKHVVEPEEMSRVLNDDGKGWRRMCSECKSKLLDLRAEAKRNNDAAKSQVR